MKVAGGGQLRSWLAGIAGLQDRLFEFCRRRDVGLLRQEAWLVGGEEALRARVEVAVAGCFKKWRVICLVTLAFLAVGNLAGFFSRERPPAYFARPARGQPAEERWLQAEASYKGVQLQAPFRLFIRPRAPGLEEIQKELELCGIWLDEQLGLPGLEALPDAGVRGTRIEEDLTLPDFHQASAVSIAWESDQPARISPKGQVSAALGPETNRVLLTATLSLEGVRARRFYLLEPILAPGPSLEKRLGRRLEELAEELASSEAGDYLWLPGGTAEGVRIRWLPTPFRLWLLPLPAACLLGAYCYLSRLEGTRRRMEALRRSVEEDLPRLSYELTLLLQAGLVVSAAFDEMLAGKSEEEEGLYAMLATIRRSCQASNASFVEEWYRFAATSGHRELLRLASLVRDHAQKGNELAGKLDRERERLWQERMSGARAQAALLETKLCFPLMLLLCSLVTLAAAPAFLAM